MGDAILAADRLPRHPSLGPAAARPRHAPPIRRRASPAARRTGPRLRRHGPLSSSGGGVRVRPLPAIARDRPAPPETGARPARDLNGVNSMEGRVDESPRAWLLGLWREPAALGVTRKVPARPQGEVRHPRAAGESARRTRRESRAAT